ncbi:flagellar hook-associated protein FlgK [Pseudomonas sp. MT-1]|uniref:flagellar hook-associated protein FlgK n=1 Tax=Stutzerimonas stutzeri TaxID=316 RepID=UPI0005363197|nr:flagellar hook-associated protein FlgK [Stutzerimonas stutzeri]MCQ4285031.1 flagellar hook-associated protein FlgK [Stutzerimonas stutzeri]BAP79095.1 flagellar hook-associated protein FlgK [Pseudomonas sp. MT-1]
MADLLNIGLSGLSASKSQLSITGHNISNVNTPGFSRQDASQATRTPQFSGAGYVGSGTTLVEIRRSYSEFLTSQLRSSTSLSSDVEAYKSQIDQLDSLLAGSTTGITPSLQKFFSALQTAAEDPANIPARQLVLAEAEGLARRFNTVSDRLTEQNNFTNKQMAAVTDQVNRLAGSIGSLNDAIATASANGKQPNDLLDARDEAVRQLSTYIGISVTPQDDNSFNISVGSGQPLVVGKTVSQLKVVPGLSDPNRHEIRFVSGGSEQGITSQITGGELGGLIRYRGEVLDSTMNSLGRLALAVSDQVNTQLGQGLDLKGNVGESLFGNYNSSALMALRAMPFSGNPSLNTSTAADASLKITDTSLLSTSDYLLEYDGNSGSGYRARRLSDNQSINVQLSGGNLTFTDDSQGGRDQGFTVQVSGIPLVGDKFTLQPTRRGAADVNVVLDQANQLAFAAPVRTESKLQNSGTGVIGQPDMVLGPSPISIPALQGLFGGNGATLTFTEPDTVTITGGTAQFQNVDNTTTPPTVSYSLSKTIQPGQSNTLVVGDANYRFEFSLSGIPKDSDRFEMAFNESGVSDNRNALKLVDLQSKQSIGASTDANGKLISGASFTDGYGELVERVGTLTAQARMDSEATGAILKQATDNRDSLSAVNLDEEAANLIKFEQYYNASAQIIQVARSLFDTLINTFR